ncbi:MAG: hypothetical protein ISR58_01785 [Anaerolineales bacterium]|nr:hypothetical protein [Chloroflexota bacterium]MBL6979897.1 hypothetical protein [Anaerolineales bacterium]
MVKTDFTIGVVGACGSGKSELVQRLSARGYNARHIAQEHSYAPDMWKRITNPDVLVFLEVSYPLTLERKKFDWSEKEYQTELYRLRHAQEHADFFINTDVLNPDEVFERVLDFLND